MNGAVNFVERLVLPTVIEPLRDEWEISKTAAVTQAKAGKMNEARAEVESFLDRLRAVTVLDPACGTGNFLYVTLEHLIRQWLDWCHETGRKLKDESISVADLLKGAMVPVAVTDRPSKVPITIEWSEDLLCRNEAAVQFQLAGLRAPFYDVSLDLVGYRPNGPIRFRVSAPDWPQPAEYEMRFTKEKVEYEPVNGADPDVIVGRRTVALSKYLKAEHPIVRFHDGAVLVGNDLFDAHVGSRTPYDPARITVWAWSGVDFKKESQNEAKLPDSIQRHVIESLIGMSGASRFDVVFDDDASGEAADVVALRPETNRLLVQLYHCKFSKEPTAGARVKDLYKVCGQAQRSVHWKGQPAELIEHLILRETKRLRKGGVSRFEQGDLRTLKRLKGQLRAVRCECEIFVVQPGLSQSQAEAGQLELLASTELYLMETYNARLEVIASS